jgi:uncharacterized damage-inducible protein DinB
MIQSVESFIRYFTGIRRRTVTFAQAIPAKQIGWSPKPGEFTCGEILRHLAAIETMTVQMVVTGDWPPYPGHDRGISVSLEQTIAYLHSSHVQAMAQLATLPDAELQQPRPAIDGRPLKAWRLLMAMIEHEVHHRSQLASYLFLMGVEPPQLFGLDVEDVITLSNRAAEARKPDLV